MTIVKWHENGNIWIEQYCLNGKLHRENGIAYKSWYENGNKCKEQYFINGKLHRENGIAYKSWHKNGNICSEEYWINGKELTKEEFDNKNNSCNPEGKIVEIDGKKYKLNEIKD